MHPHAPGKGEVAVFNRSHYEDVLVERVHKEVPKHVWQARYDFINDWEKLLYEDNNTTVLKFFLYISKEEQLARFKERLDDPQRQWKISDSDYTERNYWSDYINAFEDAVSRCSDKACAVVCDPVEPQMVPQSRGVADHCRHDGRHEAEVAKADSRSRQDP